MEADPRSQSFTCKSSVNSRFSSFMSLKIVRFKSLSTSNFLHWSPPSLNPSLYEGTNLWMTGVDFVCKCWSDLTKVPMTTQTLSGLRLSPVFRSNPAISPLLHTYIQNGQQGPILPMQHAKPIQWSKIDLKLAFLHYQLRILERIRYMPPPCIGITGPE